MFLLGTYAAKKIHTIGDAVPDGVICIISVKLFLSRCEQMVCTSGYKNALVAGLKNSTAVLAASPSRPSKQWTAATRAPMAMVSRRKQEK